MKEGKKPVLRGIESFFMRNNALAAKLLRDPSLGKGLPADELISLSRARRIRRGASWQNIRLTALYRAQMGGGSPYDCRQTDTCPKVSYRGLSTIAFRKGVGQWIFPICSRRWRRSMRPIFI
jgi:hypothetical protein